MKQARFFLFLLLAFALVAHVAARSAAAESADSTQSTARRLSYWYAKASVEKALGHQSSCFDLLRHCLRLDPHHAAALGEMGLLQYYLDHDSLGVAMVEEAVRRDSSDVALLELLAGFYMQRPDVAATLPLYERLARLQPKRIEVAERLVYLYKSCGETEKAIAAIDHLEALEGKTNETTLQKFNLYLELGRKRDAFACVEGLLDENPHDMSSRLMLADLYVDHGRLDKARDLYATVRRDDPANENLSLSLLSFYEKTHQSADHDRLRDSLLYTPSVADGLRVKVLGDLLSGDKDSASVAAVDTVFQRIFASMPQTVGMLRAYLIYQALYRHASDDAILATLTAILTLAPDDLTSTQQLLDYYLSRENLPEVERICRQALLYHSDLLPFHYYLGAALYQQSREEDAIVALETGRQHITDEADAALVSDLYSLLGDICHGVGRTGEAFAAYDSSLVYKSDNISTLNNYAYYLSLRGERLDEAERMSYRTVRQEPTNKTYLDTYAWILFEQGDYAMAGSYMARVVPPEAPDTALLADPDISAVVLEHAGDIAIQTGDTQRALRYWGLALEIGPQNAVLKRKIKERKYIKP